MPTIKQIAGSFRDPSGFTFVSDGTIYRQVNESYRSNYDTLISSGLYNELVDRRLLIPHSEAEWQPQWNELAYKILRPRKIPFTTYP